MNKTLYLIAGALLAVGASSCSSDEPGAPDVAQKDETRYIRVNILPTGSSSRAESFEDGTDAENAFGTVYMDFYDKNGNFISRSFPSDMQPADNPTIGGPNVEESYSKIVKVEIESGKENPAYVMCYINPVSYQNAAINMTNLRLEKRNNYKNGDYFAMNNSCYYADDPQTDDVENVKISGTPFPKNLKLFKTYEEANTSTEASLDIYVERYAAKVKFKLDNTKISPYTVNGAKTVNLTFVPEAWTINATEAEMFVVKNFSLNKDGLSPTATAPTLAEINISNALGAWSWNDATRNRSYWACSPGYFADQFPSVADDIADDYYKNHSTVTDGTQYGAGLRVEPYYQKYYSYNQIFNDTEDKAAANGNDNFGTGNNFMYALETTMTKAAFNSGNPKAAVPAVLVVGKYNVDYAGTKLADNTSFYLFEGNVYFASSEVKDKDGNSVTGTTTIMDCLLDKQTVLYSDAAGETKVTANNTAYNLKVMHPSSDIRKFDNAHPRKVPSRYVTLQFTSVPSELYYKTNTGTIEKITESNLKKVNYDLWTQMSVAEAYTNGKCFFYIPIRHLRWTEDEPTGAGKELETNGVINWGNLRSGDMGLVRNHVYSLKVSEVKGLATGIENLDYPILPAADNQHYIKYRVNILAWRVVPVQDGIIL